MRDNYCYVSCVDGHCPLFIEDEIYGVCVSTCDDYCGSGFSGCDTCCFLGDVVICGDCIHEHYDSSKLEIGGC